MSWKRRWSILGALTLAQVGIVVCYQGFLKGSAAPASPPTEKQVVAPGAVPPASARGALTPPLPGPLSNLPEDFTRPAHANPPDALPAAIPVPEPKKPGESLPIALVDVLPAAPPVPAPAKGTIMPLAAAEVVGTGERLNPEPLDPPAGLLTAPPSGDKPSKNAPAWGPNGWARGSSGPDKLTVAQAAPPAPPTVGAPSTQPNVPSNPLPPLSTPPGKSGPPPGLLGTGAPNPLGPIPAQTPEPPAGDLTTCPWVLRVEIVKGRTLMTAQTGKDVQFRVSCDKLELQAPRGSILAAGNVSVSSEGLQGSCDNLTIAWQKDQVVLEGRAELKCQRDGQEVDLKAAKLSLRLSVPKTAEAPKGASQRSSQKPRLRPQAVSDYPGRGVPASWSSTEEPPAADRAVRSRKKPMQMPEID